MSPKYFINNKLSNYQQIFFQIIGYILQPIWVVLIFVDFSREIHLKGLTSELAIKYCTVLLIVITIACFSVYLFLIVPYRSYKLLKFEVKSNLANVPPPVYEPNGYLPPAYSAENVVVEMPQIYPSHPSYSAPSGPPPPYVDKN
jgi:hypothetical protein